jgi:hypothetical protein
MASICQQETWRHIENFSTNSLALHVSSESFSKKTTLEL